jgi:hypothetical protein
MMSEKEQNDFIETKAREALVYQAIECGVLHTLREDIENAQSEEDHRKLVKFRDGLYKNMGVKDDEVYRIVTKNYKEDGTPFPQVTYAKIDTVMELVKRDSEGFATILNAVREKMDEQEKELD